MSAERRTMKDLIPTDVDRVILSCHYDKKAKRWSWTAEMSTLEANGYSPSENAHVVDGLIWNMWIKNPAGLTIKYVCKLRHDEIKDQEGDTLYWVFRPVIHVGQDLPADVAERVSRTELIIYND